MENTLGRWWGRGSWVSIWYGDLILLRLLIPDRFVSSFIFCCKLVAYIFHIHSPCFSWGFLSFFHFCLFFFRSFFFLVPLLLVPHLHRCNFLAGDLQRERIAASGGFIFLYPFFFFLHLVSFVLTGIFFRFFLSIFFTPWGFFGIVVEDL